MRRSRDAHPSQQTTNVSASLVPTSLSSPLGILDVATLQFLLTTSDLEPPSHRRVREDHRPPSSELARAYGVSQDESDASWSPRHSRRRVALVDAKRRRAARHRLEPMDMTPSPFRPQRSRRHRDDQRSLVANTHVVPSNCSSPPNRLEEAARNPVVYPSAHHLPLRDNRGCVGADRTASASLGATSEWTTVVPPRRRSLPYRQLREATNNERHEDDNLRRQVEWIHAHFPVRRLANTKCSLALRGKIFVDTVRTNLLRGTVRKALVQWKWVVAKVKQIEISKLKAVDRLVAVYTHAARDQLAHRFGVWMAYVRGCRDMERLAAAVAIQHWVVWCRKRREGRESLMALRFARAVATAHENATRIQRQYRVHTAKRKLQHALQAVTTIQRSVRATKRRRLEAEQLAAARRLEELYAQLRLNEQLERLTMRSRDRQARRIAETWRGYAAWRAQLVREYVDSMVDQVEFFSAVMSIQRRLRGYQCRIRIKRKARACTQIQRAWRYCVARTHARTQRKMLLLTQNMAASCLQRTFQRNRERKKYRAAMIKSSRPMFMRALGASASFRVRFHVSIVKSAVSVIQSTWRRHVAYTRWKLRRDVMARRIQLWQRRARLLSLWKCTARFAIAAHHEARRHHAARRLQRWLTACTRLRVEGKRAIVTRQLLELLQSVMTIQRYYRGKKDPWRRLVRDVLYHQLPRYRHASKTIKKYWRGYADQRHRLLSLYGPNIPANGLPRSLGLHGLQEYLTKQQRELERRTRAAQCIQRAYRRLVARREGRLLLKRYRLLFQRELRRRQQRGVIHSFLVERQEARATRHRKAAIPPSPSVASPSVVSSLSSPAPSAASPESVGDSTMALSVQTSPSGDMEANASAIGDDPDVVQCWSDERQSFYWFNARTGEATWCS